MINLIPIFFKKKKITYVIKSFFKGYFNRKFGVSITKSIQESRLRDLLLLIKKNYIKVDLIRIGDNDDGGYLVPNLVSQIDVLFSPGVAKSTSFETSLLHQYGIFSYMIDASVDGPKDFNCNFEKLYLGSKTQNKYITLKDWLHKHDHLNDNKRKMLQMDIEGSEYEVLLSTDLDVLKYFDIILIEFHHFTDFMNTFSFLILEQVFDKLLVDFYIVHLHPNNTDRLGKIGDLSYPQLLEFTFLRKDLLLQGERKDFRALPHELDVRNNKFKPDINLSLIWSNI
jgi:hypothetical protein